MYRTRTINKILNVDNLNQYQSMKEKKTPRESVMRVGYIHTLQDRGIVIQNSPGKTKHFQIILVHLMT